ncbi:hypothetical protein [Roseobacter ponti]|uniref:Transmembrane protein n=1 Tax=Roseobacter ponti TaxID=1891787 RepID=A0A858SUT3_9RHOB|nr:hypothetical protein [Roseobacter ponti]QJF51767.1 hypothetical protein G3256_11635 [Roseobacter ponti]
MRRVITLVIVAFLAAVLLYLSGFWNWSLWSRPGLFGIEALHPQGDLVARWLRGTKAAPYSLLIWAVGVFVVLTLAQKLFDRLPARRNADDD